MDVTNNYVPTTVRQRAVIGQSVAFELHARWSDGTAFDLSGFTVEAPFVPRYDGGAVPPVAAWAVAATSASMTLSITPEQCAALAEDQPQALWGWAVWITDADERIEFARGDLLLVPA